jgi:hypothetical protein
MAVKRKKRFLLIDTFPFAITKIIDGKIVVEIIKLITWITLSKNITVYFD